MILALYSFNVRVSYLAKSERFHTRCYELDTQRTTTRLLYR